MSTFYKRDGDELAQLIAGDISTWDALQLDWDDRLVLYCQQDLRYDDVEVLVHEAWRQVQRAVMRWKPGVDSRQDDQGNPVVIERALTLNYVKLVLKRLAQAAAAQQRNRGGPVVSLDAPIDAQGATRAALVPDLDGRGVLKEAQLREFVADLETQRLGDEELAAAFVRALLEEGLLLARALEWLIGSADPALEEMQQQVVLRRWLLAQEFWQIGRDLRGCGTNSQDKEEKEDGARWASNQHQAALKRMRRGIEAVRRG